MEWLQRKYEVTITTFKPIIFIYLHLTCRRDITYRLVVTFIRMPICGRHSSCKASQPTTFFHQVMVWMLEVSRDPPQFDKEKEQMLIHDTEKVSEIPEGIRKSYIIDVSDRNTTG
ncbi:uncharacterized protein TNIN_133241 [Trichonephila inaurata madagascariensis]|uniref:Uncharacterized protein n=1 Tax=Trichonephila inaurata madagascariensis TaxID=2747483 RepID=A0A8X7BWG6_9ARAC|nr:uncharacterized protein TNIN_133241 [Trichonephila inaurata madagascariensis]